MSSDTVLRCRDLHKTFNIYRRPIDRIAEVMSLGYRSMHRPFHALSGVDFDLRRGESVAILGVNGSGKSTLLQILAGTMVPSAGRIEVTGRVAALLELGAGFIGEVTARENAVLAARLYGMTEAEAIAKMDWIASFSELGEHLDTPVKFFSSGMYARLAFAVAVAVKPDVILIDEALSVGDVGFQRKAEAFLKTDLADAAKVIVSHDHESVARHCTRAIVLQRGRVLFDGAVEEGLRHVSGTAGATFRKSLDRRVQGRMEVVISDVRLKGGSPEGSIAAGQPVEILMTLEGRAHGGIPCILGHFWTEPSGREIFGASTESMGLISVTVERGLSAYSIKFLWPKCAAGTYRLNLAAVSIDMDGNRIVQCRIEEAAELLNIEAQSWGVTFFVEGSCTAVSPQEPTPPHSLSPVGA